MHLPIFCRNRIVHRCQRGWWESDSLPLLGSSGQVAPVVAPLASFQGSRSRRRRDLLVRIAANRRPEWGAGTPSPTRRQRRQRPVPMPEPAFRAPSPQARPAHLLATRARLPAITTSRRSWARGRYGAGAHRAAALCVNDETENEIRTRLFPVVPTAVRRCAPRHPQKNRARSW